jgi:hypothetical protein
MAGEHKLSDGAFLEVGRCGPRDLNPPNGFSCQLRLSPPPLGVCGLDYPFTVAFAVGAARLVSTPSRPECFFRPGLARDRHFTGFPEFEQFCIAGFPASTQLLLSPLGLSVGYSK